MALASLRAQRYQTDMLNTILHGTATALPPLMIVHGLYGSARNWGVIAKRLSDSRQVIAVDLRNHGQSPWHDIHSYPAMAEDLNEVVQAHGGQMDVIGHSMGGKAAMMLALNHPDTVRRLLVADIAPVSYGHDQNQFIKAMRTVDLDTLERRSQAEEQLGAAGVDAALQSFFTQSLDIKNKRWRLNLDALEDQMPNVLAFPDGVDATFEGPALFLSGANSDYVKPEYRPQIKSLFPKAKFAKIPGAGHWLHAEKPREFEAAARAFLSA